ncbi:hypothetical protein IFM89_024883 [Coptis chinensis]|uniref:Uncharacterized protein n=1 Tax=Coptis chinensis TaxID=261450 RepID=A0A835H7I9_9MAGN|nr:hypothetical protein IFM89_024883 [Coptis chinensis]
MANFWEKVLSSSGNMCGWMGNEFDLGIMQQSTHEIVAEFSRSFLKVGEGETKALTTEETSPVRGTSTGDHIDAEFSRSSEKVEEVEATKALMSVEKCHANGTSCGDHIDAEFSRSFEKVEEGEATKALMPVEKCHAKGTSSGDHIDAKFSRYFEKVGEGESTKVLMSIETCHARGISSEDHVDVEAQSVFSTYSEGKTVQYKNPVSSESFLSTSSDRYTENNQGNVSKRKRGRPKGSGKKYNKKMPMAFSITLESQGG